MNENKTKQIDENDTNYKMNENDGMDVVGSCTRLRLVIEQRIAAGF